MKHKRLSLCGLIERKIIKMENHFLIVAALGLFLSACSAKTNSTQESAPIQDEDKGRNTAVSGIKKSIGLPNWLLPPPKGALVTQVITVYEHPVTGERYQTNTGGYTIVVK
jgi:hypothetical protein